MKLATLSAAALLATTAGAYAHSTKPIERTLVWQNAKIERERASGQLTRSEYYRLRAEQDRIAAMERAARADGVVTGSEYREIRAAQYRAGDHIYQESHDSQKSWLRRIFYRAN